MKIKKALRFLFIVVSIIGSGQAYAQTPLYFDEFGASCKSIGMGQAFTAVADDYSAAYYNPAGLTQVDSIFAFTIGYYYSKPIAEATFTTMPYRYDNDMPRSLKQGSAHGLIVGMTSNLEIDSVIKVLPLFKRFSYGMTYFLNLPVMVSYDLGPEAYRPHYFRYDAGYSLMNMALSLGVEITPWLSVGTGGFLSQDASANEDAFSAVNRSNYIPFPGFVADEVIGTRVSIKVRAKTRWIPLVGILLKPPIKFLQDKIALGASWRAKNALLHADGRLQARMGLEDENGEPIIAIPIIDVPKGGVVGFQPMQVTVALAIKPMEGLLFSADGTWKKYSDYIDYLRNYPYPLFKDVIVPRVGLEYAFEPDFSLKVLRGIERIAIREGYFFEPTPVSTVDWGHNILDTDKHVLTMGMQFDFRSTGGKLSHSLEAYGQVQFLEERDITNDHDNYFGPIELQGYVYAFGASITTKF